MRSDKYDLQLRHYFHLKHISLSPLLEFTSSEVVLETTSSLSTSLARTTKDFQIDVWNLPPSRASHLPMNKKATNENLVRGTPSFLLSKFSQNLVSRMCASLLFSSLPLTTSFPTPSSSSTTISIFHSKRTFSNRRQPVVNLSFRKASQSCFEETKRGMQCQSES